MKVKICGIKNLEDSIFACESGADYLGFNYYESSVRYITPEESKSIIKIINDKFPTVLCVGVFVNHTKTQVSEILNQNKLHLAQFSGNEPPSLLEDFYNNSYKAIRSKNVEDAKNIIGNLPVRSNPPTFLLDSYEKGSYGGSGKVGNWKLAKQFSNKYNFFLAGGLNTNNVKKAINEVDPWGVDVASGVEEERGIKSHKLIHEFIKIAKLTKTKYTENWSS